MVITATSRWATWDSSCASTPSNSSGVSRRRMPVVAQTTARFGVRPVANALGRSESAIATAGFGRSDIAHSRSITPCSSGASSGVTSRPPIENSAILSEYQYWMARKLPATSRTSTGLMLVKPITAAIAPT